MLRQAVPSLTPSMMFSLPPLDRYRHWLSGWAVALVGLVTTYWLVQQQWQSVAMVEQTRFTQEARAFTDALSQRVAANTEIVYGLHNLFALNPQLGGKQRANTRHFPLSDRHGGR